MTKLLDLGIILIVCNSAKFNLVSPLFLDLFPCSEVPQKPVGPSGADHYGTSASMEDARFE